ncbi:MAG: prolyl-tRNA synthetase associated domain-containing protein [Alphaproteobacteria bacterium]|nr:prolyl-tRNA synthetase associated domain-containing protein [Alphaproteobacteria bacterium]
MWVGMLTPDDLLARLEALGIAAPTHRHPPLRTVEESKQLRGELPGGHCKNLFLRDGNGGFWLVVTLEDRRIDLKWLAKRLGAGRFSFGKPEQLRDVLGVETGAVTPFAIANDPAGRVRLVLDSVMMATPVLNFHPLTNDATIMIAAIDLARFVADCGHEPLIFDLVPGETHARP